MNRLSTRARFLSRLVRARLRGRPLTLSHLVTSRCDGRCPTCLWRDRTPGEMDTATVRWLYGEAGRAGIAHVVLWGGEPLLRPDLPELLEAARRAGMATTLISNGWSIGKRWPELRGLVDVLILSLDETGAAHDRMRGLPGLYERLEEFGGALRGDPLRPALLVNMVLSRENRGALGRVAATARRWGAGLYLCPMETGEMTSSGLRRPPGGSRPPPGRAPGPGGRGPFAQGRRLAGSSTRVRISNSSGATRRVSAYTCRAPRAILTVQPDGVIRDCLRRDEALADVRELRASGASLASVFSLPRYRDIVAEAAACSACNNPDVVELSWLWDLRPAMLRKVVELASR